jgi:hypothetical protein
MTTQIKLALGFVLILLTLNLNAQTGRLKSANRAFDAYSYVEAVRMYEDFVRDQKKHDPTERKEALEKLAYCYRKLQDSRNAERVYAELIQAYPDVDSRNYLYYGQALASNKNYREAQKIMSKYSELQSADLRGRKFTVAYMDMNRFYKDSSMYRLEYLSINSRQADFSPMYYKSGLVFVSARNESGVIKRVFGWNQTPFLDLYFAPDTSAFKGMRESTVVTSNAAALSSGDRDAGGNATTSTEDSPMPTTKSERFSRTLNTKYHEGPVTFFKDYSKIVFTRNNYNSGKARKSSEGINKLKLFTAGAVSKNCLLIATTIRVATQPSRPMIANSILCRICQAVMAVQTYMWSNTMVVNGERPSTSAKKSIPKAMRCFHTLTATATSTFRQTAMRAWAA